MDPSPIPLRATDRGKAFTLIELLVVIGIIAVLAALLFPALTKAKSRVKSTDCLDHLRQIGIGFHLFATDHQMFPMALSTNAGGTLQWVDPDSANPNLSSEPYRHFRAIGRELGNTRILICPADSRLPAEEFSRLENSNVSYFIQTKARPDHPLSVLSGDSNLKPVLNPRGDKAEPAEWTWDGQRHDGRGNLLFADSSVRAVGNQSLTLALVRSASVADSRSNAGPANSSTVPATSSLEGRVHAVASSPEAPPSAAPVGVELEPLGLGTNINSSSTNATIVIPLPWGLPRLTLHRIPEKDVALLGSAPMKSSSAAEKRAISTRELETPGATKSKSSLGKGRKKWIDHLEDALGLVAVFWVLVLLFLYKLQQKRRRAAAVSRRVHS